VLWGSCASQLRYCDDIERHNDSDLHWNAIVIQSFINGSQSIGLRGWASYRRADVYRQDYGLFINRAFVLCICDEGNTPTVTTAQPRSE